MPKTTKLVVTTDAGIFTRETARAYQFVVVANGETDARIDRVLGSRGAQYRNSRAYWAEQLAGTRPRDTNYDRADKSPYTDAELVAAMARLDALIAPIESGAKRAELVAAASARAFGSVAWSSRLDLARKEAAKWVGTFREVRIYAVATGARVQ